MRKISQGTPQELFSKNLNRVSKKTSLEDLKNIRGVAFDIDDTFSSEGKITSQAFSALWELKKAGFLLVPVTGRPAGWCDHIVRFWPVDAVVGENGAFLMSLKKKGQSVKRISVPTPCSMALATRQKKLLLLRKKIERQFPQAKFASDQAYREHDLAIDICEDVPAWKAKEVDRLLKFCKDQGAQAKLSSIHVNTWFGDYDKKAGFKQYLESCPIKSLENWVFLGDSPNDEPLFEYFKYSFGVANLKPYLPKLRHPPTWITKAESGAGFSEVARMLLQKKR